MRARRGQAIVEVALGLLVLVPIIIAAIYFSEAAMFRLEATEAATEPMWDATAYQQQSYTGAFVRTPGAVAAATAGAMSRQKARTLVFTKTDKPTVACTAGGGLGLTIAPTSSVYVDNGGMTCTSKLKVDPNGITRFFVDTGRGAMFKEPLANMERQFDFCQNEACKPFKMAIGDWGMTDLNNEDAECQLTQSGCTNEGFFSAGRSVYEAHRTGGGTLDRAFLRLVQGVVVEVPDQLWRIPEYQMSFRGEESQFIENVPVSEGDSDWHTTPALGAWSTSYAARTSRFLGR